MHFVYDQNFYWGEGGGGQGVVDGEGGKGWWMGRGARGGGWGGGQRGGGWGGGQGVVDGEGVIKGSFQKHLKTGGG